ncbi:MAG: formylglycine-generating enzyme family protein [Deltaproteobacteria bacterium]|nr:formylglycine-generating enzyme family protein [Deltaproteobacteria bacterium]
MRFIILRISLLGLLLSGLAFPAFAADKTFTNGLGMEFALIPSGSFMMGSDVADKEKPRHKVTISQPFYLGVHEVTQAQWQSVMGNNPSQFADPNNPVEMVSWDDAQEFIKRLNAKEGHNRYRLPTEAEWEYAARAGSSAAYGFGDDAGQLDVYAWHSGNSSNSSHPAGQKKPNASGRYDLHGNVWEWVQDLMDYNYYANSPGVDPQGPASGEDVHVLRGGSFGDDPNECRVAYRSASSNYGMPEYGFRLVLSLE